MSSNTTKILLTAVVIGVVVIAFGAGFFVRSLIGTSYPEGLDKIAEIWDIIERDYVDQSLVTTDNLSDAAIEGMIEYLEDPYTSYLDTVDFQLFDSRLSGDFEGIGAYVTVEDGRMVIVSPIIGSPAEEAGIRPGDIILEINGNSVDGMNLAEAIMQIRGEEGTPVTLTVLHEGDADPVEIEITRARVTVSSVLFDTVDSAAHIVITQFDEHTAADLEPVLRSINDNPDINGIVLDLRGNSGGLLVSVIDVASYFIDEGLVVEVRSNNGVLDSYYVDDDVDTKTDLPMVVLVDGFSASGSEVLAGALQDHDRAVIAGSTTFGKGSVNVLYQLEDGSGLYLTIARWLTPDGRIIEGEGIEPDIMLDVTGEEALEWAVNYLAEQQ